LGRSFRCSLGIEISRQSNSRVHAAKTTTKEKKAKNKKKQQLSDPESYICTHCSTLVSPEWRKRPKGPKTLCNACGCRLTKSENCIIIADRSSALGEREEKANMRRKDVIDVLHDSKADFTLCCEYATVDCYLCALQDYTKVRLQKM
jgi:hypothetical protein